MYDKATCNCGRSVYTDRKAPMGCESSETSPLAMFPYATAFVRPQHNPRLFNPVEALCKGTMFPDLFHPTHY